MSKTTSRFKETCDGCEKAIFAGQEFDTKTIHNATRKELTSVETFKMDGTEFHIQNMCNECTEETTI